MMNPITLSNSHQSDVLCVDSNSQKLITGGEGGEIYLWDKTKLTTCIEIPSDDDVTSLCFSKKTNSTEVYGSCGNAVFLLDLRNAKCPVWFETCATDDINQVCINDGNDYLALANDTNNVNLMELSTKHTRKLKGHTSASYTAQFRDGASSLELVTGGFDCNVINWNCSKAKPYKKFNMTELIPEGTAFINPPYVLSLMFNRDGSKLACGIGNSMIKIFNSKQRQLQYLRTLDSNSHSNGVCQVHFPKFVDNLLISGGNDGKINFWNLDDASDDIVPKLTINNGEKINWLSSVDSGQQFIVVCDTSSVIKLYDIPG